MIKDWMGYVEDGKVRVIEVEPGLHHEYQKLADELGAKVIAWPVCAREFDAQYFTEEVYREQLASR